MVGVAHVPTCMATPSYVSAMFSTREAPLALLSESCREGLVHWTQTTMAEDTVRCSPQPSPSSSSQVALSLRGTALQIISVKLRDTWGRGRGGVGGVVGEPYSTRRPTQLTLCIHIPSNPTCPNPFPPHTPPTCLKVN